MRKKPLLLLLLLLLPFLPYKPTYEPGSGYILLGGGVTIKEPFSASFVIIQRVYSQENYSKTITYSGYTYHLDVSNTSVKLSLSSYNWGWTFEVRLEGLYTIFSVSGETFQVPREYAIVALPIEIPDYVIEALRYMNSSLSQVYLGFYGSLEGMRYFQTLTSKSYLYHYFNVTGYGSYSLSLGHFKSYIYYYGLRDALALVFYDEGSLYVPASSIELDSLDIRSGVCGLYNARLSLSRSYKALEIEISKEAISPIKGYSLEESIKFLGTEIGYLERVPYALPKVIFDSIELSLDTWTPVNETYSWLYLKTPVEIEWRMYMQFYFYRPRYLLNGYVVEETDEATIEGYALESSIYTNAFHRLYLVPYYAGNVIIFFVVGLTKATHFRPPIPLVGRYYINNEPRWCNGLSGSWFQASSLEEDLS